MLQVILPVTLLALMGVLYLVTATVLVRRYLLTQDVGFLWLGAAAVVWPILSEMLSFGQRILTDRLITRGDVGFPFSLVERGRLSLGDLAASLAYSRQLVGLVLLLVAVFYLGKTTRRVA